MADIVFSHNDCNPLPGYTEIYVFRVLIKKLLQDVPVFFSVESGIVKPVDICIVNGFHTALYEAKIAEILLKESKRLNELIKNNEPTNVLLEENQKIAEKICSLEPEYYDQVKCLKLMEFDLSPERKEIICNGKVKINIKFKMVFQVMFLSGKLRIITMPDEEGIKFCFGNNITFPIEYNGSDYNEILDIDRLNKWFLLKITIPIKELNNNTSLSGIDYNVLQSRLTICTIKPFLDIFSQACSCSGDNGTKTGIELRCNMIGRIGLDQSIRIETIKECYLSRS